MREYSPIELSGSVTKSARYFRHARWKGRRQCPRCGYRLLYHLKDKRFGCRRCKYKFGEFTGTYIGEFNFSLDKLVPSYVPIRSGSTCIQDQVLCTT